MAGYQLVSILKALNHAAKRLSIFEMAVSPASSLLTYLCELGAIERPVLLARRAEKRAGGK